MKIKPGTMPTGVAFMLAKSELNPISSKKNDTSYGLQTEQEAIYGIALGLEDTRAFKEPIVTQKRIDDTLPGGPTERTFVYQAPFSKYNRQQDFRIVWQVFSERFSQPVER